MQWRRATEVHKSAGEVHMRCRGFGLTEFSKTEKINKPRGNEVIIIWSVKVLNVWMFHYLKVQLGCPIEVHGSAHEYRGSGQEM